MKVTNQDVKINFMGYGEITVPKGTRVTSETANGYDENYNFVDDFSFIRKNYKDISYLLVHDATYHGIDIPKEFVTN